MAGRQRVISFTVSDGAGGIISSNSFDIIISGVLIFKVKEFLLSVPAKNSLFFIYTSA